MRKPLLVLFSSIFLLSLILFAVVINPMEGESEDTSDTGLKTIQKSKGTANEIHFSPNIVYSKIGKRELKMHLLLPKRDKKPKPLILFIKGSSWGKYKPQDTFTFIPQLVSFAKNGYVVASVEHRTSHEAVFPAQLYDIKTAVQYLKDHAKEFQIDEGRIGLWGTSSGAHLAALLATSGGALGTGGQEEAISIQAVVDWYGPIDFLKMVSAAYNANDENSAESLVIGGPIQQNIEKVKKANPMTYITPDDPPFLIMHGDQDKRVPFHQSELLYHALKKANVEVALYKIKDGGHGGSRFAQQEVLDTVQAFFDRHLK